MLNIFPSLISGECVKASRQQQPEIQPETFGEILREGRAEIPKPFPKSRAGDGQDETDLDKTGKTELLDLSQSGAVLIPPILHPSVPNAVGQEMQAAAFPKADGVLETEAVLEETAFPKATPQTALTAEALPAQPEQTTEHIDFILEGDQDNTDIAPLIVQHQKSDAKTPGPAEAPDAVETAEPLETADRAQKAADPEIPLQEVVARTPLINPQPDKKPDAEDALHSAQHPDLLTCPPENESEPASSGSSGEAPDFLPGSSIGLESEAAQKKPGEIPDGMAFGKTFDLSAGRISAETFEAPQATPKGVPVEDLFDEMIERISTEAGNRPRLQIDLKPDSLGRLTIDLVMGEQGITAKIRTSDEGVRNLLASQLNSLTETLAQRGVRVEGIDIVYASLADKAFDDRSHSSGREPQNQNSRSTAGIPAAETHSAEKALFDSGLYWPDSMESSVEYRA